MQLRTLLQEIREKPSIRRASTREIEQYTLGVLGRLDPIWHEVEKYDLFSERLGIIIEKVRQASLVEKAERQVGEEREQREYDALLERLRSEAALPHGESAGPSFAEQQLRSLESIELEPHDPAESDHSKGTARPKRARTITSTTAAAKIQRHLDDHHITQVAFAEDAGISPNTLGSLLRTGTATGNVWKKVAAQMGISVEELLKE